MYRLKSSARFHVMGMPLIVILAMLAAACAGDETGNDTPASGSPTSGSPTVTADPQASPDPEGIAFRVHEAINHERRQAGLAELDWHAASASVAEDYSCRMLEEDFFAHADPEGADVVDRIADADIRYTWLGENLAKLVNPANPVDDAVEGWMLSEGHRENILRESFEHAGVGVCSDDNTYLFTQIFLAR